MRAPTQQTRRQCDGCCICCVGTRKHLGHCKLALSQPLAGGLYIIGLVHAQTGNVILGARGQCSNVSPPAPALADDVRVVVCTQADRRPPTTTARVSGACVRMLPCMLQMPGCMHAHYTLKCSNCMSKRARAGRPMVRKLLSQQPQAETRRGCCSHITHALIPTASYTRRHSFAMPAVAAPTPQRMPAITCTQLPIGHAAHTYTRTRACNDAANAQPSFH